MIVFADGALADLERIFDFHLDRDEADALAQVQTIRRAVSILDEHPHIGRPVPDSQLRELVISVGRTGFVALYHYDELDHLVRVLGVRHQREAGFRGR